MNGIANLIATLGVALISLIGVIIQTKSKEKQDNILVQIEAARKESKAEDTKILDKIDKTNLSTLKTWLISEMTKIETGLYIPNEEQKALIHEAKREYNHLGGDSYVDDMFDRLRKQSLI